MTTTKVALYLRYSSDQQDDATIETQRIECTDKASKLWPGCAIVEEYVDTAQSGKVEARPDFQRMIRDAKVAPRPWDVLMVRKFDRFARDVTASRVYKTMLRRIGIKVVSAREDIDTDTATGRLLEVVVEAVAAFYSENLAIETKSGMTTNARRGFRNGGMAPYGYRNIRVMDAETGKERTKLEINDDEARVVRHLFTRYLDGVGLKAIISEFRENGWKPRKASAWSPSMLHNLLRYPVYYGRSEWNAEAGAACDTAVPVIIDRDTWAAVQHRLEENSSTRKSIRTIGSAHPFAGMIFCGKCGGAFIVRSKLRNDYRLCCANRNRHTCDNTNWPEESKLVGQIRRVLVEKLLTREAMEEAVREYVADSTAQVKTRVQEIPALKRRLATLERQIETLLTELSLGELPRDLVKPKLTSLQEDRAKVMTSLGEIEETADATKRMEQSGLGDIEEILGVARSRLLTAEGSDLKAAFEMIGLRIDVFQDHLKVSTAPLSEGRAYTLSAGSGT